MQFVSSYLNIPGPRSSFSASYVLGVFTHGMFNITVILSLLNLGFNDRNSFAMSWVTFGSRQTTPDERLKVEDHTIRPREEEWGLKCYL